MWVDNALAPAQRRLGLTSILVAVRWATNQPTGERGCQRRQVIGGQLPTQALIETNHAGHRLYSQLMVVRMAWRKRMQDSYQMSCAAVTQHPLETLVR